MIFILKNQILVFHEERLNYEYLLSYLYVEQAVDHNYVVVTSFYLNRIDAPPGMH